MPSPDRPLRADARRNRDRILEAARESFAAEGVTVPLDEIARRAGVGPGTLYRHFPTKEALFEAIVHDRLRLLVDRARAARTAPDPAEALFATLRAIVADAQAKSELIDALAGAHVDVRTSVAASTADLRTEITHLLTRAQSAGAIRPDASTPSLMALLGGLLLSLRHPAPAYDPGQALTILQDGLRPPPPTQQRRAR
ncbi:TetR/AcrR family transcriptional regulator [Actinocorallia aurea]